MIQLSNKELLAFEYAAACAGKAADGAFAAELAGAYAQAHRPNPLEGGDAAEQPAGPQAAQQVAAAHVKLVQLFYDEQEHQEFYEHTDALREKFQSESLSHLIMALVRQCAKSA